MKDIEKKREMERTLDCSRKWVAEMTDVQQWNHSNSKKLVKPRLYPLREKVKRNIHSKKYLNFPIVSQWKFGGNGQFSLGN